MTSVRTLIFVLTALLALPGLAQAKGKKKKSKPSQDEPAMIDAALRISPKGLRFGMSPKKVGRVYEKVIDRDYLKRFQKVSPGIEQQRLEHEIGMDA